MEANARQHATNGADSSGQNLRADRTVNTRVLVSAVRSQSRLRTERALPGRDDPNVRSDSAPRAASNGRHTNRYRIESVLGAGGMGQVYRVRCQRLGKAFALKRMRESIATDPTLRRLFYREARLASSLSHPNIVSVVDFGSDPEFGLFMVMELVDGEPLTRRMSGKQSLPLRTVCEVVLQIADALHYMHKRGIVHGDLKPDNVLLKRARPNDQRRWSAKLLDFGLAHLSASGAGDDISAAGTPAYMAPERLAGARPTPAQDIFSLGVLIYQLTTGALPFGEEGAGGRETAEAGTVPALSARLGAPVDARFEEFVSKTLALRPEDRHRDMAAFIYELRTAMDMLGFGRRRRGFRRVKTLVPIRDEAAAPGPAALAFAAAPIPIALVSERGSISIANQHFARFVGHRETGSLLGLSVFATHVHRLVSTLKADIAKVCTTGRPVRRPIVFAQPDGDIRVTVELNPAGHDTRHVVLSIHGPSPR